MIHLLCITNDDIMSFIDGNANGAYDPQQQKNDIRDHLLDLLVVPEQFGFHDHTASDLLICLWFRLEFSAFT